MDIMIASSPTILTTLDRSTTQLEPPKVKIHANFQIARPPPGPGPKSSALRLSPKLVLQIQQLIPRHRPIPVLEIWQPPLRKSNLTRDFAQRPKMRSGDIYATLDEPYICSRVALAQQERSPRGSPPLNHADEERSANPKRDIVAALCQDSASGGKEKEKDAAKTGRIHFRETQCSWQASVGITGPDKRPCYRFTILEETRGQSSVAASGPIFLQWEKRDVAGKNGMGAVQSTDGEQFVLLVIDRAAQRKSRVATMTPAGLEITVRKTSTLECLRSCWDLLQPISGPAGRRDDPDAPSDLERWLYTQVLTLGGWVAQQEGWLH